MFRHGHRKVLILGTTVVVFLAIRCDFARATVPDAWRDDANLHAVHFVGRSIGWAVGDHGAAYRTIDGGNTWEARPIPDDVPLRAVFFLTDRTGWAAGGTTIPFTETEPGSVYRTDDAGVTWRKVNSSSLPRLHSIRFFTAEKGIAAGAAAPNCASGVLSTPDGGVTWTPLQGGLVANVGGWRGAAFPEPGRGAVVGTRGRRAIVGAEQLLPSRDESLSLRGLHAVSMNRSGVGWAAGDGGLILHTTDGGLVWQEPSATVPNDARDFFDFRAVSAVGQHIRVAGQPGGVVWHSPDGGHSWRQQPTNTSLPIEALHFSTEQEGVAVGAMGMILKTNDGQTWKTVKGGDRRAALMSVSLGPQSISFAAIASLAGDQGYRAVTVLPARHDLSVGAIETPNLDLRTHDAVIAAGGTAASTDWALPLVLPEIEQDRDALIDDWSRRTEGKFQEVLVGRLVAAVRTWRPDVVLLEEPAPNDAVGDLIFQAGQLAALHASDPTRFVEQRTALPPWQVKKIYVRRRNAASGDAKIERNALLSRLGTSTADFADAAAARVGVSQPAALDDEFFELVPFEGSMTAGPFFAGLALAPGSAARREVTAPQEDDRSMMLAARQRTIRAYAAKTFDDPRHAAGIIAQLDELSAGLSPAEAARQLFLIAEEQRAHARWDLAERSYLALIERFPSEPPSRKAMAWLLRYWTGAEPVWRRMRTQGTTTETVTASNESLTQRIDQAMMMAEQGIPAFTPEQIAAAGLSAEPLTSSVNRGAIKIDDARSLEDESVRHWRQQAIRLGRLIRQVDPIFFATPEVQFPLATATRSGGVDSAALLPQLGLLTSDGTSSPTDAASELATTKPAGGASATTAICRRTAQPPHLDGIFSDHCWRDAKETTLVSDESGAIPAGSLVLLSYDEKFLYVAASLTRIPGRMPPVIELAGRVHDAETKGNDRLVITLDVDRDYSTYYRFGIDARGRTTDDCWGDSTWNPEWFVAVAGEGNRWRIEAAIPFAELGPRPANGGELWAASITRIVPAVGVQSWPRLSDEEPRPESFGLVRFE